VRFDEFVKKCGASVSPVDRFPGLLVEVGVPPGWEPLESATGLRVWFYRDDPRITEFGANAVLTMHRVEALLDAGEVFATLSEQQLQSVPGVRGTRRELVAATEGTGVVGLLVIEISNEIGTMKSLSRTRILNQNGETLIAQLTTTALCESLVEQDGVWLTVRKDAAVDPDRLSTHRFPGG